MVNAGFFKILVARNPALNFTDFNNRGDFNVIFVDWGPLAESPNYFQAAQNALNVGDYTGEFLANLMEESGLRHRVSICIKIYIVLRM